jgi:hypothetical protein
MNASLRNKIVETVYPIFRILQKNNPELTTETAEHGHSAFSN